MAPGKGPLGRAGLSCNRTQGSALLGLTLMPATRNNSSLSEPSSRGDHPNLYVGQHQSTQLWFYQANCSQQASNPFPQQCLYLHLVISLPSQPGLGINWTD